MTPNRVVSRQAWLAERKRLLDEEKAFTRARDALSARRRELAWCRVEKDYAFDGPQGRESLAQLFGDKSQLIVMHFMLGQGWPAGCPMCSYWADGYNGFATHIERRDAAFLACSSAPLAEIEAYRKRMGWTFKWVSSAGSDFNRDYHVTFTDADKADGKVDYNYRRTTFPSSEAPGVSVFAKDDSGAVYHTYSAYSRGLDMLNGAYHFIDLLPKGRDEAGLKFPMAWVRRHDEYDRP